MDSMYRVVLQVVLVAGLLLLISCNNTPTVPVPPPEMTSVSPPGQDGYALVSGDAGTAKGGDIILVFNYDLNAGVITVAESDGSFYAEITAEVGHTLLVQIKRDNELSDEEELVVPSQ